MRTAMAYVQIAICAGRWLLLLVAFSSAIAYANAKNESGEIYLNANIQSIQMISGFVGSFVPVDNVPFFVIVLKLESPSSDFPTVGKDSVVAFGIHSPTRVFYALGVQDDINKLVGRTFVFLVTKEVADGRVRFRDLRCARPGRN